MAHKSVITLDFKKYEISSHLRYDIMLCGTFYLKLKQTKVSWTLECIKMWTFFAWAWGPVYTSAFSF